MRGDHQYGRRLGQLLTSSRHAAPVSPGSIGSVGAPCETNRTGIFMLQILNLLTTEYAEHTEKMQEEKMH